MRRLLSLVPLVALATASLVAGCGGVHTRAAVTPPPTGDANAPHRAPVVLAIVVDQLSAWIAETRVPVLPPDGAFARLTREGTWVKALRYPYSVTDTAPGHAALHTGEVPEVTGIFANEVPDTRGERISILRDESTKLVAESGVVERAGASAGALHAETVAERLRKARPDAFVLSISLKDRGAILPAGRGASHTLWFDAKAGSFVTSTAFATSLPSWVGPAGGVTAIDALRGAPWTPLDPAWLRAHAATPDDAAGEGDYDGLGTTFPHVAKTSASFRATPAADAAIVATALAGAKAGHRAGVPTLVLASFSTHDMVGHVFGPDSWEAWDQLRRLDAQILALWRGLESITGGPVDVVLSADHGDVSMPEAAAAAARARGARCPGGADALERPCEGGVRMNSDAIRDELREALARELGRNDLLAGVADPYVFLTPTARALPTPTRSALDAVVRRVLERHAAGIARVLAVDELLTSCPAKLAAAAKAPLRALPGEDVLTLVCRAVPPRALTNDRLGDFYVVPKPGSFFDADYVPGHGTSHGTPYLYDRTVPLFVHAAGRVPVGIVSRPVDFSAYAALEASLLGLTPDRSPAAVLEALTAR